jgi:hypothetical protein
VKTDYPAIPACRYKNIGTPFKSARKKEAAFMINCTCYHSTGSQPIRHWSEQISPEQDARIREGFASQKPINKEPLATKAGSSSGVPQKPKPVIIETGPVTPFHTGYARIDNAITDALKGKSQELKDNVYQIIRRDFLPHNVHGLTEEDRLAQIGLGVEKAQYLADQFMDDRTKSSFMEAMRSIAKIGASGTRVGSCEMDYNVKDIIQIDGEGYVHEDHSAEYLYAMEMKAPKEYETYKKLKETKGDIEAAFFMVRWAMKNLDLIKSNRKDYKERQEEQYKKLEKVELDQTFAGADTSSKERFLASIQEKLHASKSLQISYFLEQMANMTKTPGNYLFGRRQVFTARA